MVMLLPEGGGLRRLSRAGGAKVDHLMMFYPADHLFQSYPSPALPFATPAGGALPVWGLNPSRTRPRRGRYAPPAFHWLRDHC